MITVLLQFCFGDTVSLYGVYWVFWFMDQAWQKQREGHAQHENSLQDIICVL